MSDCSTEFESFSQLPPALQLEALREGEERLRAQLDVATASDARALNLIGMLIAAITASLGGCIAFLTRDQSDYFAAILAFGFGALLIRSAVTASSAMMPDIFRLPGNSPAHWLPREWDTRGTERAVVARARREQAEVLADAIKRNAAEADQRAQCVREAIWQVGGALWAGGIGVFALTIFRIADSSAAL